MFMEEKRDDLKVVVTQYLQQSGITANLLGYHYLRIAIIFAVEEPKFLFHMGKLYQEVAAACQTEPKRVERAIWHAIQSTYNKNPDMLKSTFYYPVEKPCNAELIAVIADDIRIRHGLGKQRAELFREKEIEK